MIKILSLADSSGALLRRDRAAGLRDVRARSTPAPHGISGFGYRASGPRAARPLSKVDPSVRP